VPWEPGARLTRPFPRSAKLCIRPTPKTRRRLQPARRPIPLHQPPKGRVRGAAASSGGGEPTASSQRLYGYPKLARLITSVSSSALAAVTTTVPRVACQVWPTGNIHGLPSSFTVRVIVQSGMPLGELLPRPVRRYVVVTAPHG
jgi:hypothetical protein